MACCIFLFLSRIVLAWSSSAFLYRYSLRSLAWRLSCSRGGGGGAGHTGNAASTHFLYHVYFVHVVFLSSHAHCGGVAFNDVASISQMWILQYCSANFAHHEAMSPWSSASLAGSSCWRQWIEKISAKERRCVVVQRSSYVTM